MNRLSHTCRAALLIFLFGAAASAETPVIVWKSSQGEVVAEQARVDARRMIRHVKRSGFIEVTITLKSPYDPSIVGTESQEHVEQEGAVVELYGKVIEPLIERGAAWHSPKGEMRAGPVIVLRVNQQGLRQLFKSSDVLSVAARV